MAEQSRDGGLAGRDLSVQVLGPAEVRDVTCSIRLGARQERAVLVYLALHPREAVAVARLIDLLWADDPPAAATKAVQTLIFRLRKRLALLRPAPTIETHGSTYRLDVAPQNVDAARCAILAREGHELLAAGAFPAAAVTLGAALDLFDGSPVPHLGRTPLAIAERARLDELRTAITVDLLEARLGAGRSGSCVADIEAAIVESPHDERLHGLLMVALYRSGRQGDALAAFQRARNRLVEDLGIEPGPDLRRVERSIIDQDPDLAVGPVRSPAAAGTDRAGGPVDWSWAPTVDNELVGRRSEMARTTTLWTSCATGRRRRLLLVSAEAGMGKTRFTAEIARHATASGALVLRGACDPGSGSYAPFDEALDTFAANAPPGLVAHLVEGIDAAAQRVTRLIDRTPTEDFKWSDVDTQTSRSIAASAELIGTIASTVPTLLILDDLHWAAEPALRLLLHLMRRPSAAPLLIIGTHRAGLDPDCPLRRCMPELHRTELVDTMTLNGLDVDDVAQLVTQTGHPGPGPATGELATQLRRVTAGNPYFIASLVEYLQERGRFDLADADWASDPDILGHGLPRSIADVLDSRIDALGDHPAAVLEASAIAGLSFHVDATAAIAELDRGKVLTAVEKAVRAGLVDESDRFGEFAFAHDLVRQVLLDRIGVTRRATWHWRAAEALRDLRLGTPREIGLHARAATIASPEPARLAQMLRDAAADAIAHGAPGTAAEFLDDAITAATDDADPALLADLCTDRAIALLEADIDPDSETFVAACTAAEHHASRSGCSRRIERALTLEHRHQTVEHVDRRRIDAVDRALDTLPVLDRREHAVLSSFAAELRAYSSDAEGRLRLSDAARGSIEDDTPNDVRETVLINLALAHAMDPDELGRARALADDLARLGRPVGFAVAAVVSALCDLHHGQIDSAAEAAELIRDAGASRGSRAGIIVAISLGLSVAVARAGWDTFDQLMAELSAFQPKPRTARFHATITRLGASAAELAGHPTGDVTGQLLDAATIEGYEVVYTTTAGWSHLLNGRRLEASAIWRNSPFATAATLTGPIPGAARLPTLAAAADLAVEYGTKAHARAIQQLLIPYSGRMVVAGPMLFGPVDVYLASLAARLDRPDQALALLDGAADLCRANRTVGWDQRIMLAREKIEASADHDDRGSGRG